MAGPGHELPSKAPGVVGGPHEVRSGVPGVARQPIDEYAQALADRAFRAEMMGRPEPVGEIDRMEAEANRAFRT